MATIGVGVQNGNPEYGPPEEYEVIVDRDHKGIILGIGPCRNNDGCNATLTPELAVRVAEALLRQTRKFQED